MKHLVRTIERHSQIQLYRDTVSGIAWVEDELRGVRYPAHPSVQKEGGPFTVDDMKRKGYWRKDAKTVETDDGFVYNVDKLCLGDEYASVAIYTEVAVEACRCEACAERTARACE